MADLTREKNGEWLCKLGEWHMRGTRCEGCCAERIQSYYVKHSKVGVKLNISIKSQFTLTI